MARLDTFLRIAADQRASDLHFHAGKPPIVRHNGELLSMPYRDLSAQETHGFLEELLDAGQWARLEAEHQVDFAYELEGTGRFRVNVYQQAAGLGAVFRVIPSDVPDFEDLRLPSAVLRFAQLGNGLILVTGPTGSGKSTTLASLIKHINTNSNRHIITVEDPIEYVHASQHSQITQREVGMHAESFGSALRSALREAPDVLVVGEVRDYETVSLILGAAEAGVLVFATLHTNSAAKAVDRLLGACPADEQEQSRNVLSVLLRGVIAQRLVRTKQGRGRVAAVEVLLPSHSVANLIRENKIHQLEAHLRTGDQGADGMRSLEHALLQLVLEGQVSPHEALLTAGDPDFLERLLTRFDALT